MRRLALFLLTTVFLSSCLGIVAFACEAIEPRLLNTFSSDYSFSFKESTSIGTAGVDIVGKTGVDRIQGQVSIYRQDGSEWIYVTGKSSVTYDQIYDLYISVTGTSGAYYKAEYTVVVYKNDTAETLTHTCYATCP